MDQTKKVILDFLDSSSINGLNQVLSAKAKISKLGWILIILSGLKASDPTANVFKLKEKAYQDDKDFRQ